LPIFDHADAVVQRVSNINVPVRRGRYGARRAEGRLGGRLVVAVVSVLARARNGRDDARWLVDAADAVVVRIRDDQIAVGRDRHAVGRIQLRVGRLTPVAGKARAEIVVARYGRDDGVTRVDA